MEVAILRAQNRENGTRQKREKTIPLGRGETGPDGGVLS